MLESRSSVEGISIWTRSLFSLDSWIKKKLSRHQLFRSNVIAQHWFLFLSFLYKWLKGCRHLLFALCLVDKPLNSSLQPNETYTVFSLQMLYHPLIPSDRLVLVTNCTMLRQPFVVLISVYGHEIASITLTEAVVPWWSMLDRLVKQTANQTDTYWADTGILSTILSTVPPIILTFLLCLHLFLGQS